MLNRIITRLNGVSVYYCLFKVRPLLRIEWFFPKKPLNALQKSKFHLGKHCFTSDISNTVKITLLFDTVLVSHWRGVNQLFELSKKVGLITKTKITGKV